jgi:hypothetical protein
MWALGTLENNDLGKLHNLHLNVFLARLLHVLFKSGGNIIRDPVRPAPRAHGGRNVSNHDDPVSQFN